MALTLIACSPAAALPGTPQPFASACDRANEGQQIAVEGYLRLPDTLESSTSAVLRLYPDITFTGRPIGVVMIFGDGANQARKITTSFRDDDLKVRLADGAVVPFGTKVRVSGRLRFPVIPQDFDCTLDHPYLEAAK